MRKNLLPFFLFFTIGITSTILYFGKISLGDQKRFENIISPTVTPILTFSLDEAPSKSLVGVVFPVTGNVGIITRTATEAAKIDAKTEIKQGESIVVGTDSTAKLEFSGMLRADIDTDTQLDLIQTLPANIVISQNTGKVTYVKTSEIPLTVRIFRLIVDFTQASIEIEVDAKLNTTRVSILEGDATLAYNNLSGVVVKKQLASGEVFLFSNLTRSGRVL